MNTYIRKLGRFISKIPLLGKLKPIALKIIKPMENKAKRKHLLSRGLKILQLFDETLSSNNIKYSLIFGTLLGAIREKGFIKHDLDIDVAVWNDVDHNLLYEVLNGIGFELIRSTMTDNGDFSREDTYMKDGVQIDIFFFYPYNESNLSYTTVYVPFSECQTIEESIQKRGGCMPIQLILPVSKETTRVKFENLNLPVITNYIEFLEARYGKEWKIPDPTFVYPKMGDVKCKYRKDKITKITIWK